jgi:hypothetical protein
MSAVRIPAPRTSPERVTAGRRRRDTPPPPLGSLTQRESRRDGVCAGCGSTRVTRLSMNLTDGTPVDFTSCHRCEHRAWHHAGGALGVEAVLEHTRKR